jgi:signal peptide peptidase SppA
MSESLVGGIDRVVAFALEHPWALTAEMRALIGELLARRLVGQRATEEEISAAVGARRQKVGASGGIAVIPIHGVISPRMNMLSEMSGGATCDGISADLSEALATSPRAIVLDIDSPGGNVAGGHELAREVLAARAKVPVIAQSNHLMGSLAYWIGSCATEIVASPSSLVGSVGVYTLYNDISAALDQMGIKRTLIAGGGAYKGEGADGGPLSEEALAHRKAIVGGFADQFLADVAAGRGVEVGIVRETYGQGRVFRAPEALRVGMVNRIGTLHETIARLGGSVAAPAPLAARTTPPATAQEPPLAATAQEHAAIVAEQLELVRLLVETGVTP